MEGGGRLVASASFPEMGEEVDRLLSTARLNLSSISRSKGEPVAASASAPSVASTDVSCDRGELARVRERMRAVEARARRAEEEVHREREARIATNLELEKALAHVYALCQQLSSVQSSLAEANLAPGASEGATPRLTNLPASSSFVSDASTPSVSRSPRSSFAPT